MKFALLRLLPLLVGVLGGSRFPSYLASTARNDSLYGFGVLGNFTAATGFEKYFTPTLILPLASSNLSLSCGGDRGFVYSKRAPFVYPLADTSSGIESFLDSSDKLFHAWGTLPSANLTYRLETFAATGSSFFPYLVAKLSSGYSHFGVVGTRNTLSKSSIEFVLQTLWGIFFFGARTTRDSLVLGILWITSFPQEWNGFRRLFAS